LWRGFRVCLSCLLMQSAAARLRARVLLLRSGKRALPGLLPHSLEPSSAAHFQHASHHPSCCVPTWLQPPFPTQVASPHHRHLIPTHTHTHTHTRTHTHTHTHKYNTHTCTHHTHTRGRWWTSSWSTKACCMAGSCTCRWQTSHTYLCFVKGGGASWSSGGEAPHFLKSKLRYGGWAWAGSSLLLRSFLVLLYSFNSRGSTDDGKQREAARKFISRAPRLVD